MYTFWLHCPFKRCGKLLNKTVVNNFCAAEVKTNSENSNFHGISEIHFGGHLLPTENRTNGRRQLPFVFCKFKTKTF